MNQKQFSEIFYIINQTAMLEACDTYIEAMIHRSNLNYAHTKKFVMRFQNALTEYQIDAQNMNLNQILYAINLYLCAHRNQRIHTSDDCKLKYIKQSFNKTQNDDELYLITQIETFWLEYINAI